MVGNGLYLGKRFNPKMIQLPTEKIRLGSPFYLSKYDILTHAIILGMTGSGKTVLGKIMIEEAALNKIPSILIDLKGDLASLKLIFPSLEQKDFIPFIEGRTREEIEDNASKTTLLYRSRLKVFEISPERLSNFSEKARVVILTPRSKTGVPLAISSLSDPPANVKTLLENEPETVLDLISSVARLLIMRLFPGDPAEKHRVEEKFLNALIQYAWGNDVPLRGIDGLFSLIELVQKPPFEKIGALDIDSYISPRERHELAVSINNLLIGIEKMWHTGLSLDIESLIGKFSTHEKTPIIVVNLNEIPLLEDKIFVVSCIAHAIYDWMQKKGSSGEPRLIFYIDEIGGGGGKSAIFPIHPYNPPSKPPLMLLIKQARAFGVCCIFATQNPGDIDYKGLSNCGTWIIGKLSTSRDRGKVLQGLGEIEALGMGLNRATLEKQIASLESGEFVIKTKRGDLEYIKERWLMSYHKTMTSDEIRRVTAESDRRIKTEPSSLPHVKQFFLSLRYPFSEEEIKKRIAGDLDVQIKNVFGEYYPFLLFDVASEHLVKHSLVPNGLMGSTVIESMFCPLFQEKAKTRRVGKFEDDHLLDASRKEDFDSISRKIAVAEVWNQAEQTLLPTVTQNLIRQMEDQLGQEEKVAIEQEKIEFSTELEEIDFKIEEVDGKMTEHKETASILQGELKDLRSDYTRRLREGKPTKTVLKSISSREQRMKKLTTRFFREKKKKESLLSLKEKRIESHKKRINMVEEKFGAIRKSLTRIRPKLKFENEKEINIPVISARVILFSGDSKKSFDIKWNGYNGTRISNHYCDVCNSPISKSSPLDLCSVCLKVLCTKHEIVCPACAKSVCPEHSWRCENCKMILCPDEKQISGVGYRNICKSCARVRKT